MGGPKRKRPSGGDYDERVIGLRIDRARADAGFEIKQFCDEMGWHKSEYTRKLLQAATPLWPGEAGRAKKLLKKPTGWPYIDEALGEIIDSVKKKPPEP